MTIRNWLICSLIYFGLVALTPAFGALLVGLPPVEPSSPTLAGAMVDDPIEAFMGRISQLGGKFVFIEDASNSTYALDDQAKAEPFDGKRVKLTGALDKERSIIRVRDIQPL